jgi:hypothetical protein
MSVGLSFGFSPPDSAGFKCQITREHQMVPTYDTVIATHFHKVGDKFYVILKDGKDVWVDDCIKIE